MMPEVEFARWTETRDDPTTGEPIEFKFYLAGMRGTVQFVYYDITTSEGERIRGANDLGYHSPRPMYPGQRCMGLAGECHAFRAPHRGVADCYYDGSGLNARPVLALYDQFGEEGLWEALRDYYFEVFWDDEDSWNAGYVGEPYRTPEETRAAMLDNMRTIAATMTADDPMATEIRAVIAAYEKEKDADPVVPEPPED